MYFIKQFRLLLVFVMVDQYRYIHARDSLTIIEPESLINQINNGVIDDIATALFGTYVFGQEVIGPAYYSAANPTGCKPFDLNNVSIPDDAIFVMDRTDWFNCAYVTQALNAQNAGAIALVIIDNRLGKWDPDWNTMGDSSRGLGQSIVIPSVMIQHSKGSLIRKAILKAELQKQHSTNNTSDAHKDDDDEDDDDEDDDDVTLALNFDIINKSNQVTMQLFLQDVGGAPIQFIKEFAPVAEVIDEQSYLHIDLFFRIHRKQIWDKSSSCINGKYCIYPWVSHAYNHVSMLQEMVRQMCMVKSTRKHEAVKWWNYATLFHKECSLKGHLNVQCSERIAALSGINFDDVMFCVKQSGGYEVTNDDSVKNNTLLDANLHILHSTQFNSFPQIIVNQQAYKHGSLTCPIIDASLCGPFSFVCSAYRSPPQVCLIKNICPRGTIVDVCGDCTNIHDPKRIHDKSLCSTSSADNHITDSSSGVSARSAFAMALGCSLVLAIILGVIFTRRHYDNRRYLADRMSQYVAVDEYDERRM